MDPAIWRRDQFGNLLMAGLNFNCKGCLCYTFDHRYPISNIGATKVVQSIVDLMSSIDNCQALSFRANALKGSNDDADVTSVIDRFGCDRKTMLLLRIKILQVRVLLKIICSVKNVLNRFTNFTKIMLMDPTFWIPRVTSNLRMNTLNFLTGDRNGFEENSIGIIKCINKI